MVRHHEASPTFKYGSTWSAWDVHQHTEQILHLLSPPKTCQNCVCRAVPDWPHGSFENPTSLGMFHSLWRARSAFLQVRVSSIHDNPWQRRLNVFFSRVSGSLTSALASSSLEHQDAPPPQQKSHIYLSHCRIWHVERGTAENSGEASWRGDSKNTNLASTYSIVVEALQFTIEFNCQW